MRLIMEVPALEKQQDQGAMYNEMVTTVDGTLLQHPDF